MARNNALTYRWELNRYSIYGQVGVAGPDGTAVFGSEATVHIRLAAPELQRELEVTVQVGGLSAHDTAFARARIAAWTEACTLADFFEVMLRNGHAPRETFELAADLVGLTADCDADDRGFFIG